MNSLYQLLDGHMYVIVVALICLAVLANTLIRSITSIFVTGCRARAHGFLRRAAQSSAKTSPANRMACTRRGVPT